MLKRSGQALICRFKVARELMEHQYEFEIVSVDMMLDAQFTDQTFVINEHAFQTLVIPYTERMPDPLIKKLTARRIWYSNYFY